MEADIKKQRTYNKKPSNKEPSQNAHDNNAQKKPFLAPTQNTQHTPPARVHEDLICVGAVAGAIGVRGELRIKSFTDIPMNCTKYGDLRAQNGEVILPVHKARPLKNGFIALKSSVSDRTTAEELKSTKLYVKYENLPSPQEDEYYYHDLIDFTVCDQNGDTKGHVLAVHDFGAGPLLEIVPTQTQGDPSSNSFFHAFTKQNVPIVDTKARHIVIEIIDAL